MSTMFNDSFVLPPVLAVTSGKGGVGKSVIAVELAQIFARENMRVLLVDGDIGLGNLHILTNTAPIFTVEDLLLGTCKLDEATINIQPYLDLIPAASGSFESESSYDFRPESLRQKFADACDKYDLIIVDTASGISPRTSGFVNLADQTLVMVTPELSALADGYAILKTIYNQNSNLSCLVAVNMTQSRQEGETTVEKFQEMARTFLKLDLANSIWLPYDRQMKAILLRQSLIYTEGEGTLVTKTLRSFMKNILSNFPVKGTVQNLNKADNVSTAFALSSKTYSSDKKDEYLRAQELESHKANPKHQVSRKDTV